MSELDDLTRDFNTSLKNLLDFLQKEERFKKPDPSIPIIKNHPSRSRLLKNAAMCKTCQSYLESKSRHDFVTCACGRISIDGGLDYQKWSGNIDDFINLSEWSDSS